MYSNDERTPDVSPGNHCLWCRQPIPYGPSYCGDWCDRQDNNWWESILVRTGPRDPMQGRGWLTNGSFG